MRLEALLLLLFLSSGPVAQGSLQIYGGNHSHSLELSYLDSPWPLSMASFLARSYTTGIEPVHLGNSLFPSDRNRTESLNRSDYYHPISPLWDQFAIYLPLFSLHEWFTKYNESIVPSDKDFLKDAWSPASDGVTTPTVRQFVVQDSYREGVEAHDDPDRMELGHFMESDEPPGRPLL